MSGRSQPAEVKQDQGFEMRSPLAALSEAQSLSAALEENQSQLELYRNEATGLDTTSKPIFGS
jgi:hypothetical protein